jgi:hypothetical protein
MNTSLDTLALPGIELSEGELEQSAGGMWSLIELAIAFAEWIYYGSF